MKEGNQKEGLRCIKCKQQKCTGKKVEWVPGAKQPTGGSDGKSSSKKGSKTSKGKASKKKTTKKKK
jgi:hypothetical protein